MPSLEQAQFGRVGTRQKTEAQKSRLGFPAWQMWSPRLLFIDLRMNWLFYPINSCIIMSGWKAWPTIL